MLVECWCHLPIVAMVPEWPRCPAPAQLRTKGQCLGKQSERGWAVQGAVIVHSPYSPQLNEIRRCHCFQNPSLSRLNGNNGVAQKLLGELRNNAVLDWGGNIESIHSMEHSGQRGGVQICRRRTTGPIHQGLVNNFSQLSSGAWL